jgi:hypothetical protein
MAETYASSLPDPAMRRGMKDADAIDSDKKLEGLRSEPEYQRLLAPQKNH